MNWNYRIVRYKDDSDLGLHEVFYNEAGEATGMTEEPVSFACYSEEGPEGIIKSLELALADASKYPVFDPPEVWAD